MATIINGSSPSITFSDNTTQSSGITATDGVISVASGGTGLTTAGTNGQVLTSNGTTLSYQTPAATGVTSVGGTGTVNGITLTGTVTSTGNLTLGGTLSGVALASQVSGTLPVANGGTGATTLTSNNVLLGNGTSALQVVAPGTSGNVLTSNGTTWTSAAGGLSGSASQLAKAWVHFNGSNPATIQASYNVSSVTYTSTGRYVVNFTNALADAKYAFAGASSPSNDTTQFIQTGYQPTYGTNTSSACYLAVGPSGAVASSTFVTVVFFR